MEKTACRKEGLEKRKGIRELQRSFNFGGSCSRGLWRGSEFIKY